MFVLNFSYGREAIFAYHLGFLDISGSRAIFLFRYDRHYCTMRPLVCLGYHNRTFTPEPKEVHLEGSTYTEIYSNVIAIGLLTRTQLG